jgi:hypothetical protein
MALVLSPPSACALAIMRQLTRLPDELTYNPVLQALRYAGRASHRLDYFLFADDLAKTPFRDHFTY